MYMYNQADWVLGARERVIDNHDVKKSYGNSKFK